MIASRKKFHCSEKLKEFSIVLFKNTIGVDMFIERTHKSTCQFETHVISETRALYFPALSVLQTNGTLLSRIVYLVLFNQTCY